MKRIDVGYNAASSLAHVYLINTRSIISLDVVDIRVRHTRPHHAVKAGKGDKYQR